MRSCTYLTDQVQQRPQVIDDFFRNFLLKSGPWPYRPYNLQGQQRIFFGRLFRYDMKRSLDVFQAEWYEMQQTGKFKDRSAKCNAAHGFALTHKGTRSDQDSELTIVPDVYTRNHGFQQEAQTCDHTRDPNFPCPGFEHLAGWLYPCWKVLLLREELEKARMVAAKASRLPTFAKTTAHCMQRSLPFSGQGIMGQVPQRARLPSHAPPASQILSARGGRSTGHMA